MAGSGNGTVATSRDKHCCERLCDSYSQSGRYTWQACPTMRPAKPQTILHCTQWQPPAPTQSDTHTHAASGRPSKSDPAHRQQQQRSQPCSCHHQHQPCQGCLSHHVSLLASNQGLHNPDYLCRECALLLCLLQALQQKIATQQASTQQHSHAAGQRKHVTPCNQLVCRAVVWGNVAHMVADGTQTRLVL
jgi:hypothetical protein